VMNDGLENFESDLISEEDTSDILNQFSRDQKDMSNIEEEEEEKKQEPSFDHHFLQGESKSHHRRTHSRSRRKAGHNEPLSKNLPKDILSGGSFGASKNLLLGT